MYAWEPALEDAIDEIRVKEMALVRKASVLKTLADMLNIAAPFLVRLFLCYPHQHHSGSTSITSGGASDLYDIYRDFT